jgi:hypothetical protein
MLYFDKKLNFGTQLIFSSTFGHHLYFVEPRLTAVMEKFGQGNFTKGALEKSCSFTKVVVLSRAAEVIQVRVVRDPNWSVHSTIRDS